MERRKPEITREGSKRINCDKQTVGFRVVCTIQSGMNDPDTVAVCVLCHVPTLCDPMDCSPPGSSVRGIFPARTQEWISSFQGSSQPRYRTCISASPAAAAKSLQSCPTPRHPIEGSPPGSSVPGILQAGILEWVAISFSNACMHARLPPSCLTLCDFMDSSSGRQILFPRATNKNSDIFHSSLSSVPKDTGVVN